MTEVIDVRSSPVRLLAGGAALLVIIGIAVVTMTVLETSSELESALDELSDDDAFTRATDAGVALTRVSEHLEAAADDCDQGDVVCDDMFTAAAFARVGAVNILRCGRPEIFAFRQGLREYVESLRTGEPIVPPPAPTC